MRGVRLSLHREQYIPYFILPRTSHIQYGIHNNIYSHPLRMGHSRGKLAWIMLVMNYIELASGQALAILITRPSLYLPPWLIDVGILNLFVISRINASKSKCLHPPSKFVHVCEAGIADSLVIGILVDSYERIPADGFTSPSPVDVDIIKEGTPKRIYGQDRWIPNNYKQCLCSRDGNYSIAYV